MWPNIFYYPPGPSTNSTTIEFTHYIDHETLQLGYFDIQAPIIQSTDESTWSEMAESVLEEDHELWQRLSGL